MRITLIHPSRGRFAEAAVTAALWAANADNVQNIEYILSADTDDPTDYEWFFKKVLRNNNRSAIDAINNAAKVSTGDLIVVCSDDFEAPAHWDTLLLKALEGKSNFCVKTDDGLQATLITLPIMDRAFYESMGYVYFPEYSHLFCDQELTAVAIMSGRAIKLSITFLHNHYTTGRSERDVINIRNDRSWAQGEALFNERLKTNFGIEKPVINYSDIRWK